jgi:Uma2 family endonuclease
MVTPAVKQPLLSATEYLAFEETSSVRHEYVAGVLYAQAGASRRHNRIALNIASGLLAASPDSCRVSISDVKLRIDDGEATLFYYPDVMVACDSEPDNPLIEIAPCLLVEVLSPTTEMVDRREKLMNYHKIISLRSYLIVFQDQPRVIHHYRDEAGVWWQAEVTGDGVIPLSWPQFTLRLADIYTGIS